MSGFGAAGAPPAPTITGWQHLRTGKVRDLYTNSADEILLVASDRISAFDWVLPTTIPNKGAILTQLSLFWFELLEDIVPNHIISDDVPTQVVDRAVIVKPLNMFEIECVARGYLTGSGWNEYQNNAMVCGNKLPDGLLDGSKLPSEIFTPATKAEIGTASAISMLKKMSMIGMLLPAPLRPPAFESVIKIPISSRPIISILGFLKIGSVCYT